MSPPLFGYWEEFRGQSSSQHELGDSPVFIDSMSSSHLARNGNLSAFSSPFSMIASPSSGVIVSSEPASEEMRPSPGRAPSPPRSESDYLSELDYDNAEELLISASCDISNTPLAVSSLKRNAEFHEIFCDVSPGDRLIEDHECSFACGIYGRLYISDNHICFHANSTARVTKFTIPFHDVTGLTKPIALDAIKISTRAQMYVFTAFLSRDTTYAAINNIWRHWVRKPATCACGEEGKHLEELVIDTVIPAAPRAIYNLMFTGGFLKEFMATEQELTDIQISDWYPEQLGSQLLVRDMTYVKSYGRFGPIKWKLKDETLHVDFDDNFSILTTAHVSEAPGVGICTTKTRTCITWVRAGVSRLVVTTTVEYGNQPFSFLSEYLQRSSMYRQRIYYNSLKKAMHSHIAAHITEFTPDIEVEDPETTQNHETPAFYSWAGTLIPRRLDGTHHTAHHSSVSAEDSTDPAKNNSSVKESTLGFVSTEFTSTSQYPNEALDILQSQSPQYVASVMYGYLIQHGCLDLESSVDPYGFSSSAVAEGGFGDVWTGRSHKGGTKLAIKVLRFASLTGDTAKKELKRITREIYNWSKLDHENVNKLMGVIMFRERLGMVSEWMENGNLRQYLSRNDDAGRCQLCVQIARGVAYMHGVNMIHGDLKACNILVSSAGILKITDFDYSIFPECSLAFSVTSRMGGGTLRWMAPELVLDEEPPQRNLKTDIYALGMTFLETITNAHPYSECRHDPQIILKLSRREHPKLSEEHFPHTEWGNRMRGLLLQCWDFNPGSRPTADSILRSLLTRENETVDTP